MGSRQQAFASSVFSEVQERSNKKKNAAQQFTLFALVNLFLVRQKILKLQHQSAILSTRGGALEEKNLLSDWLRSLTPQK